MTWRLKEPGHQQPWYWPTSPWLYFSLSTTGEYQIGSSVSNTFMIGDTGWEITYLPLYNPPSVVTAPTSGSSAIRLDVTSTRWLVTQHRAGQLPRKLDTNTQGGLGILWTDLLQAYFRVVFFLCFFCFVFSNIAAYNSIQNNMIFHTALQWIRHNSDQGLYSNNIHHISPR